jgi:hypothetical protein
MIRIDTTSLCIVDVVVSFDRDNQIGMLCLTPCNKNAEFLGQTPDFDYLRKTLRQLLNIDKAIDFEIISKSWYVLPTSETGIKVKQVLNN